MKLLMAVKSCERDAVKGFHSAMRDTWVKDVRGADVRFFTGGGSPAPLQHDEVRLDVADDYMSLPHKTWAILRWSTERDYDFTFLCDTDTFVMPDRLLASGFEAYDLVGLFNGKIGRPGATEGRWAWISGGNGYWLSRRAQDVILSQSPTHWAEDCCVGQALGPLLHSGQLTAYSHEDYGFHTDGDLWRTRITSHYCTQGLKRSFDPQWMRNRYAYNVLGRKV